MKSEDDATCVSLNLTGDLVAKLEQLRQHTDYAAKLIDKHGWSFCHALRFANDFHSQKYADKIASDRNLPRWRCVQYVGSHHRLEYALKVMPHSRLLKQLPSLWRDSDPDDAKKIYLQLWREWSALNQGRLYDKKTLPAELENLTVFRGQRKGERFGISWSLKEEIADRFAKQTALALGREAAVYRVVVPRARVLCYLSGRGEDEVIIDRVSDYKPRWLYNYCREY